MSNISEAQDPNIPMGGSLVSRRALFSWGGDAGGKGALRVGLLAVSENWLAGCSQLKPGELVYADYIDIAKQVSAQLRAEGAEVVIAVTHSREPNDLQLTKEVPGIDLLLGMQLRLISKYGTQNNLGGHDHDYIVDLPQRVIKSGEEWRRLSHVTVSKASSNTLKITLDTIDITSDIKVDDNTNPIAQIVEKFDAIVAKKWYKVIFQTAVDLDPTVSAVRYRESALPNWICDICCDDYSMNDGFQEADVCMLFGFYFAGKAIVHKGDLTLGQIDSFFKTNFLILVIELTGAQIIQVFNEGPLPILNELLQALSLGCKFLPGTE